MGLSKALLVEDDAHVFEIFKVSNSVFHPCTGHYEKYRDEDPVLAKNPDPGLRISNSQIKEDF